MRDIKFRFTLQAVKEWGTYKIGDIDTFFISLESLSRYPIDKQWNILKCDRSTGVKDKNGVDIYEGDSFKYLYGVDVVHKVIFQNGAFGYIDNWFIPIVEVNIDYIEISKECLTVR